MPLIRKHRAGSCPGYTWDSDGTVLEVDAELAVELLAIPGGGFSEVAPAEQPPPSVGSSPATEVVEAPSTPRRGRPRKATDVEVSE